MKKVLIFALVAVSLISCATSKTTEEKHQEAAKLERQIADSLEAKTLTVTFDYVNPMRFPSHYLTTTYSLRIKGDSVASYLPYFGRAYRADYGRTDSPLSFEGHIKEMTVTKGKKDSYKIFFETNNKHEIFDYVLTIFNNGNVSLNVNSNYREPISFDGEMEIK